MHGHLTDLKKQRHKNQKLQRHYNKYGVSDITFSVIELCDVPNLIEREQVNLDHFLPFFNVAKKAGSSLGIKHTEETKRHLSKIRKGWKVSVGRKLSDETKAKISRAAKSRGIHPNFLKASIAANTGKKHTKEHRDKVALLQSKITPEQAALILQKRLSGQYQKDIAKEFGVSQRLIVRVEKGIGIYGDLRYK